MVLKTKKNVFKAEHYFRTYRIRRGNGLTLKQITVLKVCILKNFAALVFSHGKNFLFVGRSVGINDND